MSDTLPSWVPNAISAARILLVPLWVLCAEACTAAEAPRCWPAIWILVAIGASDVIDGWLARTFGLATTLGATLDAVADKLCQVFLVTWLTLRAPAAGPFIPLPLWFTLLLIARDGFLLTGYAILRRRRGTVAVVHRYHGKSASVLMFALLVMATARIGESCVPATLLAIAVLVVLSTAAYARDGYRQLGALR